MYTNMLSQMAVGGIFGTVWEWIKIALGWVLEGCYYVLDLCGIESLALGIILFTIVVYSVLLPLQIKNAKFQKLNSVMNPEIQAISKKYKNKTDNESRMKQQEELSNVYEKYGVSPTGGCLQSFIQLPILFAVYRVLYNVPNYVKSISDVFNNLVDSIKGVDGFQATFYEMASNSDNTLLTSAIKKVSEADLGSANLPNLFYQFRSTDWATLSEKFPTITDSIESTKGVLDGINNFFGVSIAETPSLLIKNNWSDKNYLAVIIAVLIPILSGFFQWLSSKVVQSNNNNNNMESQGDTAAAMASSMKTMLVIMPIFSIYICYTLPLGIGIYWTMSAVYRTVSQVFINKKMNKISVEALVEKNQEKINKKRAKKGLPPKQVTGSAKINTKNINTTTVTSNKSVDDIKKTASDGSKTYSSIREKAFMVSDYNERNNKKR